MKLYSITWTMHSDRGTGEEGEAISVYCDAIVAATSKEHVRNVLEERGCDSFQIADKDIEHLDMVTCNPDCKAEAIKISIYAE